MIPTFWLALIIPASATIGFYLGGKLMAALVEQNLLDQGWSKEAIRKKGLVT